MKTFSVKIPSGIRDGELDEKTAKFVIEKCQEARDENVWYTQEEVIKALETLEEKNEKCIKSFILKEQK